MTPYLVDSHCHLDRLNLKAYDGDVANVVAHARELGVEYMLCVGINMKEYPRMLALVERFDNAFATVGVHPNETKGEEPDAAALVEMARHPKVVAIGETGLDYFRSEGELEWQRDRFRRHIAAAREAGLPLIIHTRDAFADTARILREERAHEVGGVMHCFAGNVAEAQESLDLGFHISLSGIVTFANADELRAVARMVPAERLLVETDAPYLTPVPHRGKPNVPGFTRHVAECVAAERGVAWEELARQTSDNFFRLFPKAARA